MVVFARRFGFLADKNLLTYVALWSVSSIDSPVKLKEDLCQAEDLLAS